MEEKRRKEAQYSKEEERQSVMAIVICVVCLLVALLVFLLILDCGRTKDEWDKKVMHKRFVFDVIQLVQWEPDLTTLMGLGIFGR